MQFRTRFNNINYKYSQLKKEQEINEKLLNIHEISFTKKRKKKNQHQNQKLTFLKLKIKRKPHFHMKPIKVKTHYLL